MLSVDGNAAGGLLAEVFVQEATSAFARCRSCGRESALGELVTYEHAMGAVLRCPGCDAVMLRVSATGALRWLDTAGCSWLRFAMT